MLFQPEQNAPRARATNEITGTVDRIDDPLAAIRGLPRGAFFAEESVVGECALQFLYDEHFASLIGNGHRRSIRFDLDPDVPVANFESEGAGFTGDRLSDCQFVLK